MLRTGLSPSGISSTKSRNKMIQRLQDQFPALFRFGLGGNAVIAWYYSLTSPHTNWYNIGRYEDGASLLWLMALLGLVLMLDVLINDWTPKQVTIFGRRVNLSWQRPFHSRHYILAGLAFCYAAQPFVAERSGHGVSLLLFFYWHAFLNIAVAFLDAKLRSRGPGWQRACN